MGVWYASREDVKSALDSKETARNNVQIDRSLESGSRSIESLMKRVFYPIVATRYFAYPNDQYARPWSLWLDNDELISVTSLVSGGTTLTSGQYYLEPNNVGPPYNRVEINLSSTAGFNVGNTFQRNIAITGLFGYDNVTAAAGTLAEALDASETGVDVSDSYSIGVGDLITIDSERMLVTDKQMLTSGQTLQTPITASAADVTIAVTTGSAFTVGETILLDSERMLIVDISGNNLTVKRAWDGSVLATHTGSTIYAPRTLVVVRGYAGTTAATHNSSTAIVKQVYPGPIRTLCIAEAVNTLQQEGSAYASTVGAGENARPASGAGLDGLREQTYANFGRRARIRAV